MAGLELSLAQHTPELLDVIREIHDRMTVILRPEGWRAWLDPHLADPAAVRSLIDQHSARSFKAYEVSKRVNSPRNNDAAIIEPV